MSNFSLVNWTAENPIPTNAILAGIDYASETEIYIGIGQYKGHTLPAKIKPNENVAYVVYEGEEVRTTEYTFICCPTPNWMFVKNGTIPEGVYKSKIKPGAPDFYVGRVPRKGCHFIGRVQKNEKNIMVCYVYVDGKENSYEEFDILMSLNN